MKLKHCIHILLTLILATGFAVGSLSFPAQAGSFDEDPLDDLLIGIPGEDMSSTNAGRVNALYGSPAKTFSGTQDFHQGILAGAVEPAEADDLFGSALAVGDFNGDGLQDAAIGTPGDDVGAAINAGVVHVVYGQSFGLDPIFHSELWYQGHNGLQGTPESFDDFGAALAAGDFDGNGYDDLVIGVPNQDVGTASNAGVVQVLFGAVGGLDAEMDQVWNQDFLSSDVAEASDHFGQALAVGDFNADGRDDLAVGVPGEDIDSGTIDAIECGAVNIMRGSGSGFTSTGAQFIYQSFTLLDDTIAEDNDEFGSVLATGDFNWDNHADLIVGIPKEDTTLTDVGAVEGFYGSDSGIITGLPFIWLTRDSFGTEVAATNDHLGWALAVGDFDHNQHDDLAIGVPDFDGGHANVGKVLVAYSDRNTLTTAGYQSLVQGVLGDPGAAEANDRFGFSLAAGNFNDDSFADLVIGAPYEDDDDTPALIDAGAIYVLWGTPDGLTGANARYLHQGSADIADNPEAEDRFGEVLAAKPFVIDRIFLPILVQ